MSARSDGRRPPRAEGTFLAIVTARGGSKGLPGKNLMRVGGASLVARAIRAARGVDAISRCVVSTYDHGIAEAARAEGAEVSIRPAELATDSATSASVVEHVLAEEARAGRAHEGFVLLQPTSPLRTRDHVRACIEAFVASGANSALSVCDLENHPYKSLLISQDGLLEPAFGVEALGRSRQALPRAVRQNGAIYVMSTKAFLEAGGFFAPPALAFEMSIEDSVDIDTIEDLELAERILSARTEART